MARQRDSRVGHWLLGRHDQDSDPNRLYTNSAFHEQWNKVTQLYKPINDDEVRKFLLEGPNFKIIDYLIQVHSVIFRVFQSHALRLKLFQDPEITENKHLLALIGVHLPSKEDILNIIASQRDGDTSMPHFDEVGRCLDIIVDWWLTRVPRDLLDVVYFDVFDISTSEGGRI